MAKMREQQMRGELPADSLIQGFLVLAGGLLLLTPGFATDFLGFSMVIPVTRQIFAALLKAHFVNKINNGSVKFYSSNMNSDFHVQRDFDSGPREMKDVTPPDGQ